MKNKLAIAAVILMAAVMLASLSSAMAATYEPVLNIFNPNKIEPVNDQDAAIWQIDCTDLFSGKDVDLSTLTVGYWILGQYPSPATPLYPTKVSQADKQVKIWFSSADLAGIEAVKTFVSGSLTTGEDFFATGPGFTWGRK